MHASIEQLLAIRDGNDIVADVREHELREHIQRCDQCHNELQRLTDLQQCLRELPEIDPPDVDWDRIASKARKPRVQMQRVLTWSVAATLLVAVWLAGSFTERDSETVANQLANQVTDVQESLSVNTVANVNDGFAIDELIEQSQRLETVLQHMPQRPQMVRAGTDTTIQSLRNSIAMVDYTLSQPQASLDESQSRLLWQQRVGLMDSLVKVRFAEASAATL